MKQVTSIRLYKNTITYLQNTNNWSIIFFAGGTDKESITLTYASETDAAAAYEALCRDIAPPKEKPLA